MICFANFIHSSNCENNKAFEFCKFIQQKSNFAQRNVFLVRLTKLESVFRSTAFFSMMHSLFLLMFICRDSTSLLWQRASHFIVSCILSHFVTNHTLKCFKYEYNLSKQTFFLHFFHSGFQTYLSFFEFTNVILSTGTP